MSCKGHNGHHLQNVYHLENEINFDVFIENSAYHHCFSGQVEIDGLTT